MGNLLAHERTSTVERDELGQAASVTRQDLLDAVRIVDVHGVQYLIVGEVPSSRCPSHFLPHIRLCALAICPRNEKCLLAQAVQLVIALLARQALLDAPDDDGITAHFRPKL